MFETRYLGEERVVAARRLRAAFDDVAGDHRAGETVPVVARPAMAPRGRTDRERGVGGPAGDDDVGPTRQCLGDPPPTDIGVGGQDLPIAERLARIEVGEVVARGP